MTPLPDLVDDRLVFPVLQRLSECLCSELEKAGGPSLCYCGLMVGDIMPLELMSCETGNCGVAWVRPVQGFGSTIFPAPDEEGSCVSPLAMQLEVGVARCYPQGDPRRGMDPQEFFEAARLYMSDMQAVRRAIHCCFGRGFEGSYALGTWDPIPAQGGVSGGTWTVIVRPEV